MAVSGNLISQAIAHAAVAGGCRIWSRRDGRTTDGLTRAAGFHSARAATLPGEWMDKTGKPRAVVIADAARVPDGNPKAGGG